MAGTVRPMSSTAARIATARRAGNVTLTTLTVPGARPPAPTPRMNRFYLCIKWIEDDGTLSTARSATLTPDGLEVDDTTRMLAALRPLMRTRDQVSGILAASGPDMADLRTIHNLPHRDLRALALQLYTATPEVPVTDIVAAAYTATGRAAEPKVA